MFHTTLTALIIFSCLSNKPPIFSSFLTSSLLVVFAQEVLHLPINMHGSEVFIALERRSCSPIRTASRWTVQSRMAGLTERQTGSCVWITGCRPGGNGTSNTLTKNTAWVILCVSRASWALAIFVLFCQINYSTRCAFNENPFAWNVSMLLGWLIAGFVKGSTTRMLYTTDLVRLSVLIVASVVYRAEVGQIR